MARNPLAKPVTAVLDIALGRPGQERPVLGRGKAPHHLENEPLGAREGSGPIDIHSQGWWGEMGPIFQKGRGVL